MTREEATCELERLHMHWDDLESGKRTFYSYSKEAVEVAISTLRPITREQVEKVWRGEWMFPIFADQKDAKDLRCQCSECGSIETPLARHRFCPSCGAPMTDEAVNMAMERLEAMKDGKGD